MKRFISIVALTIGLFLFCSISAHSQEADKFSEIKTFVDKWKDLKSVSYGANVSEKPFFSSDTLPKIVKVEILFGPKKEVVASKNYLNNEEFEATNL